MKDNIDNIGKELFQKIGKEKPSKNFEKEVMDKIHSLQKPRIITYEPIIPKKTLVWIASLTVSSIVVLLLTQAKSMVLRFPLELKSAFTFPKIDVPKITLAFPELNIPTVWVYVSFIIPLFFVFERLSQKFQVRGK